MKTTIRAEGETIIVEQGEVRIVIEDLPGLPYAFDAAYRAAFNRQLDRQHAERMDAETAAWLERHPNAVEIAPRVYRDGFQVRDHNIIRTPNRGEVNPPMRVKVRGGRRAHLWMGGSRLVCGKWSNDLDPAPNLLMCSECAEKMP